MSATPPAAEDVGLKNSKVFPDPLFVSLSHLLSPAFHG